MQKIFTTSKSKAENFKMICSLKDRLFNFDYLRLPRDIFRFAVGFLDAIYLENTFYESYFVWEW